MMKRNGATLLAFSWKKEIRRSVSTWSSGGPSACGVRRAAENDKRTFLYKPTKATITNILASLEHRKAAESLQKWQDAVQTAHRIEFCVLLVVDQSLHDVTEDSDS